MNELTSELSTKVHAVWDDNQLTPVEASRQVQELLGFPPVSRAEVVWASTVYAALRGLNWDEKQQLPW
jgi:hypothetical protein